ncbi:colanic acid biosynthesis acetyltransferase WcaF [Akkermansiaceae bacterium]|nr:colanic acid biosynthesis acetyltransferase WcaF [Akkermansiaceae bacterium]MDB4544340.1 colanic acid biosynthesis acetyltransferase WcaF [Akkermansiaceae bacterium]
MDIESNRKSQKWTRKELAGRALWALCSPLFRWSPRPLWGWRRFLLRLFGAKVGKKVHFTPSCRVFIPWNLEIGSWSSVGFETIIYNLGKITIGEHVTISQRSHLCAGTHDFRDDSMPLIKATITVKDGAWICADTFIGPEIVIEEKGIVGARAVVTNDVKAGTVVAGNPAKVIGHR